MRSLSQCLIMYSPSFLGVVWDDKMPTRWSDIKDEWRRRCDVALRYYWLADDWSEGGALKSAQLSPGKLKPPEAGSETASSETSDKGATPGTSVLHGPVPTIFTPLSCFVIF